MKGIKKTICLLLSLIMILSMGVPAFAFDNATNEAQANTTSSEASPFSIEISTDKSSYSATGIAKITAKVTNMSGKNIKNVSAEAVFGELAPCKKNSSKTTAEAETLKDGESLEFTYSATINKNAKKLNIFEKIILFFVRLFNGGYSAKDNGFDNGREFVESSSDIKFGKRWARNTVKVWFGESGDDDKIIKLSTEVKELSTDEKDNKIVFTAEISNITGNVFLKCNESDLSVKFVKTDSANMLTCTAVLDNSSEKTYHFYAKSDSTLSNEVTVSIYQPFTENELDRIDAVDANIDELVNSNIYKSLAISEKALKMKELLMSLCEKGLIKNNSIKYDDELKCYEFEYADGGTAFIYIDKKLDINTSGFSTNTEIHPNNELIKSSLISEANYEATNSTYNRQGILIYDLWSAEENKNVYDYNEEVSSAWNTAGLPTTFQIDPTVDFYKTGLIGKSIIFIQEHGIELKRNELYGLSLRESVTRKATKSYSSDIKTKNKRVFKTKLADGSWSYIITPNFFSFYYENKLNDTLILLGSCMGFGKGQVYDYHFSMAFAEICKAICVVGFHNSVYTDYSTTIIGNLVLRVMDGYSVTEALNSVKSSYGDTDVQYKRKRVENLDKIVDGKNITWRTELENHEEAVPLIGGNGSIKMFNVGTVEGLVSEDETNIPLENVTIVATQNETVKTTQTNNNGKFTFILPAGTWEISVEDTDTHWCHEKQTITVEKDEEITITPPFYMKKGTKIQGCVRDSEAKAPIANAKVELRDGTNFNVMHDVNGKYHVSDFEDYKVLSTTTTDENGKYTFNMPSGKYVVAVYHDDYEFNGLYFSFEKNLDGYFPADILLVPNGGGEDDRPVTASGNCGAEGDNVKWVLYDDGELVISGSGEMKDYTSNDSPWSSLKDHIKVLEIGEGITYIGKTSFYNCTNLESISFPSSLLQIGAGAFSSCISLKKLVFQNKLTSIGADAFYKCEALVEVYLPSSLISLGDGAFSFCRNLQNIVLPEGLQSIGRSAFWYCTTITEFNIPSSVEYIGQGAFGYCYFCSRFNVHNYNKKYSCYEGVLFDKEKKTLINYPIGSTNESYIIPNTVETVQSYAFGGHPTNGHLSSIEFGPNLKSFESNVFAWGGAATVIISDVYYKGSMEQWCDIDFESRKSNPCVMGANLHISDIDITTLKLPSSITEIKPFVFCGVNNVQGITFSNNISKIGTGAFSYCKSLKIVDLPDSVSIVEQSAFSDCPSLETVYLPKNITVNNGAFYGGYDNADLTVILDGGVCTFNGQAFWNHSIKHVIFNGTMEEWCMSNFNGDSSPAWYSIDLTIDGQLIKGNNYSNEISIIIPSGITVINSRVFSAWYIGPKELYIPKSVTYIGEDIFWWGTPDVVYYEGSKEEWEQIDYKTQKKPWTIVYNAYNPA